MGKPTFTVCECDHQLRLVIWFVGRSRVFWPEYIGSKKQTRGTETSQYPEERTSTETPGVVASETGPGQCRRDIKPNDLERSAIAGDSPVGVKQRRTRVGRDT
jgi:hypothetical protein